MVFINYFGSSLIVSDPNLMFGNQLKCWIQISCFGASFNVLDPVFLIGLDPVNVSDQSLRNVSDLV